MLAATAGDALAQAGLCEKARGFAEPLLSGLIMPAGESVLDHADATARILAQIGGSETMQAAVYLAYASGQLSRPEEVIGKVFGTNLARLAVEAQRLETVQRRSRDSRAEGEDDPEQAARQTENVRKMLLAFSRDLRVVLLRLASRLQTLRYSASIRKPLSPSLLRESNDVFAPLANRLGIWQIKWELEDLIFRAQEPETYRLIASLLHEKRAEREAAMEARRAELEKALNAAGIRASVSGRPKHISSIARKMRGKSLDFNRVFDVRALRVVVPTVDACYAALGWVHEHYAPVPGEFDDYIAKPKVNGYQSLHTVVRDADGKTWEIQIRTPEMHEHAEHGVAAHWAYKEAGTDGYAGVSAASAYDAKIAVLRQLLAWERDFSTAASAASRTGLFDDRIYVFTPDAAIVELPAGATPVDLAYSVHTELGHRCRGAKVDGALVPLNTPLQNGQTVEITAAKEGGPSRDWLNADLGYLASSRARAKVRAWFNAQQTRETIVRGREMVEKLLQREGKTALSLEALAEELGFKSPDALFETVGKDELSLRSIEAKLRPSAPPSGAAAAEAGQIVRGRAASDVDGRGGVLVVGLDSLLTHPAKCCKPAPPDGIGGYVTRGRGVTVHRRDCAAFRALLACEPERIIDVSWGEPGAGHAPPAYPVDVTVEAVDRQGLLRDISDVFTRQKMNVIGAQSQTVKGWTWMTFTAEVSDTRRLAQVLREVQTVPGVRVARRR
ncbi:MAG: bifunctional (p)ppGpp synthetase/guanosine-3',5'-bis(diphosphate) 3'-pyrophosphohydrolase [Burkholderiaceae bacterium]|jgi:GTP pyrophosphokinase|nr:bifunctional (p)ppGpp synthetase/guanosine-3',5'-bis(diphosphate) 3'-pyrophosphohydrolase [Burkholderiaceae bacterium]